MKAGWKTCLLGDVITFQRGYDLPHSEMHDGPYPVIGSNGQIGTHEKYTTEPPVITIGRSGNVGHPHYYEFPCWAHNTTLFVKEYRDVDPRFVFFFLHTLHLDSYGGGSAVPTLNRNHIHNLSVHLPPLPTQRRIAAVLGALDDKIELNRKMNANLEAQAQALFKSWFVDFEPFGGKMPKEWKMGTLGEVCECVLGGTPNRGRSEYWNGKIPWINSGKVNEFRITEPSEFITELGVSKSATKLMQKKTVVLAITGATLGQVSILEIDSCANQSVIGILQNEDLPYEYIYPFVCSKIAELISHQTGGAQQHINKNDVESMILQLPDAAAIASYLASVGPLYAIIANKCFESRKLAETRDALLPKLMSGELEVA